MTLIQRSDYVPKINDVVEFIYQARSPDMFSPQTVLLMGVIESFDEKKGVYYIKLQDNLREIVGTAEVPKRWITRKVKGPVGQYLYFP